MQLDRFLGVFLPFYFERVLNPLEQARRWGLVCECHTEMRKLEPNRRVECDRNSRRTREARVFLARLFGNMSRSGRAVQGPVEGISWIPIETSLSERSVSKEGERKFGWTGLVPWLMVEARDPEQAKIIREQLISINDTAAEPLVLEYKEKFLEDLEAHI